MSDIFLSYAREDINTAKDVAVALERHGWTVFWDRAIPTGMTWRALLSEAIDKARCVIVLWSRHSVESEWVVEEAEHGLERGILLPALLEPVRVPLGFRAIQSADLADWTGDPEDPLLLSLLDAIKELVKPREPVPEISEPYVKPGNVFVSYSKEDKRYVQDLIALLRNSGLPVWADDRIDFGDRWWRTIVANIRSCVAMVVVMTPDSEESRWVEREILLADKLEKPIFPLLLKGDGFPLLITLQHHDVRDGSMPPANVIETLVRLAQSEGGIVTQSKVESGLLTQDTVRRSSLFKKVMQNLTRLTKRST